MCVTGVMMGYETSITLQTPCEVLQANAGFKREVTVNKTECDEIVDDVVWGVDSQIKVGQFVFYVSPVIHNH